MHRATNIQNLAATPGMNVLVSASAGTGKTKVLTDRFIRLMLHGTPPEKILCLTFTNAAAAEMKHRIMGKLSLWCSSDANFIKDDLGNMGEEVTPVLCNRAAKLYGLFHRVYDQLKIMTIHALCAEILKRLHSVHNPNMQILEPYEANNFQLDIIKQVLSEISSSGQAPYYQHYLLLSDYMDVQQIHHIINRLVSELKPGFLIDGMDQAIYYAHHAQMNCIASDIVASEIDRCNSSKNEWVNLYKILQAMEEKLSDDLGSWLQMLENGINHKQQWMRYLDLFLTKEKKPRQRLVSKKFATQYCDLFQFLMSEQEAAERCWISYKRQVSASLNDAVVSLASICQEKIMDVKVNKGLLTFNDLIIQTLHLLHNSPKAPGILYDLDYEIDHVLVDESQDNSETQWQIIKALTDEFFAGEGARTIDRTVFVVGDMKQSIYSFQGASPELFQEMGEFLASKVTAVDKPWHKLDMQVSFRSTQTILNLVNAVCAINPLHLCHEPVEHLAYRDGEGLVEVWPLIEKEERVEQEGWILPRYDSDDMTMADKVASFISNKIAGWITEGRVIAAKQRPVSAGDIMILVRKRGSIVTALRRYLHQHNIQVIECSKSKLKDHIIAQDLLVLLKFTLDCEDDLNLACLLKTPIFNIGEEELFNLCYKRPHSLWQQLQQQLDGCYKELLEIQQLKRNNSVLQLLMTVLYHKDKMSHFIERFGEEAKTVVAAFLDAVCEFEAKHSIGCYWEFITWFETVEIELQLHGAAEVDAVRIMTVHAAKGLQSSIVILADAASTEYSPPQRIFWHHGVPIIALNADYDDELLSQLKQKNRDQEDFESNRLLYVAITRAEDELYVMGHRVTRFKGSWYDIISQAGVSDDI